MPRKAHYEFFLQALRFAIASDFPVIRVLNGHAQDIEPPPNSPAAAASTQIVLEISVLPIGHTGLPGVPRLHQLSSFLKSREFREQFLQWYGRQVAAGMPSSKNLKKLKQSLANLKKGRSRTVPPKLILKSLYERFVLEMKSLRFEAKLPLNGTENRRLLDWAKKERMYWPRLIEEKKVVLEEIVHGNPKDAAELLLARMCNTSEQSIHSFRFR